MTVIHLNLPQKTPVPTLAQRDAGDAERWLRDFRDALDTNAKGKQALELERKQIIAGYLEPFIRLRKRHLRLADLWLTETHQAAAARLEDGEEVSELAAHDYTIRVGNALKERAEVSRA